MNSMINHCYLESNGEKLFTVILLPESENKFPTVIIRSPYVDDCEVLSENYIAAKYYNDYYPWIERGYAVVIQHTRGRGKSTGISV